MLIYVREKKMCFCANAANVFNLKTLIKYADPNFRKLKGYKRHPLINFLLFKTFLKVQCDRTKSNYLEFKKGKRETIVYIA